MKNNAESIPSEAQEAKRPEISDDDIEQLMAAFQEKDDKESSETGRSGSEEIEAMISESIGELEEGEKKKEQSHRLEQTGIVYAEAAKAADEVVDKHLKTASLLLEADPSVAVMTLLTPVNERLRASLDSTGGFQKLHDDPLKQQLYDVFARRLHHEAASAVMTSLQKRINSIGERIQTMEASDESRALGAEERRLLKLQELIEAEDKKGLSARDENMTDQPKAERDILPEAPKTEGGGTIAAPKRPRWQFWKK